MTLEPTSALDHSSGEDPVLATAASGLLVMEAIGLCKDYPLSYGHRADVISAVRDASFALYRQSVVAIVGESGSGKSTVARLLAAQEKPSHGEVRLDGATVALRSMRDLRTYKRQVQLVFQDPFASLNPVRTVGYHLQRPVKLHRNLKGRGRVQAEITQLLHEVGLVPPDQYIHKFPHELSGGQRQRVAIARALAVRPRVLLADEPVSMLDVSIRLHILGLIDDLRKRFDLAVLYITHDIATARYFADQILVMYAGEIVERGPAEEVTQRPAHPYTQLLVASAPDPDAPATMSRQATTTPRRQTISALRTTTGCAFTSRCPYADSHCQAERPGMVEVTEGRQAACWHLETAAPHLIRRKEKQ